MKKVYIIILILIILAVAGFFVYKYVKSQEGQTGGQNNTPRVQVEVGGIGIQPGAGGGSLSVCQDKCGDGICQTVADCETNDLSCGCPEAKEDCPQDCQ